MRYANTDFAVDGVTIRTGELVMLGLRAANLDKQYFPEPEVFDVHREPNPHLAFGHGPRFCPGAPLAVLEADHAAPEADPTVAAALVRARSAFACWAGHHPAERRRHLLALRRAVVTAADHIADVVTAETGKPRVDVVMAEVLHAASHTDWLARRAHQVLASRSVSPWPVLSKRAWVIYRPLGVAAVLTPWNYPFLLPFLGTATAVAAGCAVVAKPSELTPRSAALVAELAAAAGLPKDLVQVIPGDAARGAALVAGGVDVVSVTGSLQTGRRSWPQRRTPSPR